MRDRQEEIRSKGFDMFSRSRRDYDGPLEYGSIKTGTKTLNDAVLDLGAFKRVHPQFGNKHFILKAIAEHNVPLLREISNYFYDVSGIYSRVCDYFAFLYRYDWYVIPEVFDQDNEKTNKNLLLDFNKTLSYLDNSNIKKLCGDIALEVIKNGAYYGYIVPSSSGLVIQQLPVRYCRSIYSVAGQPAVEFDMRFFDECFRDVNYRMKVLKMFPKEFQKGYLLYKQGKIEPDTVHLDRWTDPYGIGLENVRLRSGYWYLLEPGSAIKFSLANGDQPMFINAIPKILDLDAAQELDRKKQMQQLLKLVIQELPLDKNGDLIFDLDEARDIHNNAVEMLQHTVGVDVLTTFADISVEEVASNNSTTTNDDLDRVERTVYNSFGISRNLFNTDSNLSLEKSILDDESSLRTLLLQLNSFFNRITMQIGSRNKKKYNFRFKMLETTQYNYQTLSKMYKEQSQLGFSKLLPQIALGHSQSSIIHTAYFENKVLNLSEIMIPPISSNTMSADLILGNNDKSSTSKSNNSSGNSSTQTTTTITEEKSVGRPAKEDSEKSEKTIANIESM